MGLSRFFSALLGKGNGTAGRSAAASLDPVRPEQAFYAIGDIHGRLDLMDRLLDRIDAEDPGAQLIFVGDYIDRGEQSRGVLERLMQLDGARRPAPVFLSGNHEDMCLKFLDDPEKRAPSWFRNGGLQTLASFGIGDVPASGRGERVLEVRDALAEAMGQPMIAWLRQLPLHWRSGNVAVVHAGADPYAPIESQSSRVLQWGHPEFGTPRPDRLWVAHGHTIVEQAAAAEGRIAVDTGAYATGRLTAGRIAPEGVTFLHA
jgi:serine/threonine protein phosphatase 1